MKASQAARLAKGHEGQFLTQRGLAFLPKRGGGSGGDVLQLESENCADCAFGNIATFHLGNLDLY